MKRESSFQEILENLLKKNTPHVQPPPETPSLLFDFVSPFFFELPKISHVQRSLRSYPKPRPRLEKTVVETQKPKIIIKSELDEKSQQKWALFEKMINQSLGAETTRSDIMAAFRKFIRSIHPDLNAQKKNSNIALYVQIKNELIATVEQYSNPSIPDVNP